MEKEYTLLFNGITDAIEALNAISHDLMEFQTAAEELYISKDSAPK